MFKFKVTAMQKQDIKHPHDKEHFPKDKFGQKWDFTEFKDAGKVKYIDARFYEAYVDDDHARHVFSPADIEKPAGWKQWIDRWQYKLHTHLSKEWKFWLKLIVTIVSIIVSVIITL